jgi:hypothetical protein
VEILHKTALYFVLTFVFIGGALTLAGPDNSAGKTITRIEYVREWPSARELTATKPTETPQTAVKAVEAEPGI